MGGSSKKPKAPEPLPPVEEVEQKEPDLQISAKSARTKKRGASNNSGLNRFIITPNTGSGASVPE